MVKKVKKKRNWRDKYRFTIVNDTSFEEVWKIRLTKYHAFIAVSFLILSISGLTTVLIAFTNLREFIPGYPDVNMRRNILMSAIRLDSLDREIALRDKYFANISTIISGGQPTGNYPRRDSTKNYKAIKFSSSPEQKELMAKVEGDEKYSINMAPPGSVEITSLASLHFFPPVKGIISGKFDVRLRHFGTDIVTKPKAVVSAALDGTVIFTGWTMETGFVIEVQHPNNIISVYKHNAGLLKETGDRVRAGDAISIVGDSGELYTSGPHLHFEIWYKGSALDPEKHIQF
jgi:murein DD-endopeptidase MepM/ murein hydrolase activator NlpD